MPKANDSGSAAADGDTKTIEAHEVVLPIPVAKAVSYAIESTLSDLKGKPREPAIDHLRKRLESAHELLKKAPVVEMERTKENGWTFFDVL